MKQFHTQLQLENTKYYTEGHFSSYISEKKVDNPNKSCYYYTRPTAHLNPYFCVAENNTGTAEMYSQKRLIGN